MADSRIGTARYYDAQPAPYGNADISFYERLLPSAEASILELGCGSGRVLVPLSRVCRFIYGVDVSAEMLTVCWEKLQAAEVTSREAIIAFADISNMADLGRRFELVNAPFRVFQALVTDEALAGYFDTVRRHLAPGGTAVLNAFDPFPGVFERWEEWREEAVRWEKPFRDGVLRCSERVADYDRERFTFKPQIHYRYYEGERLRDEATLNLHMRAYWPDDLRQVVLDHGFKIVNQWGGFKGEGYGDGSELVIHYALP